MPFVTVRTSAAMSRKQELDLKSSIGQAVSLVPGKSEASLLLCFEPPCRLYLRGAEVPAALISADFFSSEDHVGFDRFAAAVSRAFDDVLGVPPENVYIRFGDIGVWSAGCAAFDIARLR